MSSGGKGGSSSQAVEIPKWIEDPAKRNIARAEDIQQLGYTPYYGPDIAAFTPTQQTAMQGTYDTAAAFGLAPRGGDVMAGMPQAQQYAGGISGYSSAPLYDQSVQTSRQVNPEQAQRYDALYGGMPTARSGSTSGKGGF